MKEFYDLCRENNLRITPQRVAIYRSLIDSEHHPTAERVYHRIREEFPNISFDTVNRTLLKFAEIGLADIVEGMGSPRRYDPNTEMHHHLHCVKCGKVIDFTDEDYDSLVVPEKYRRKYTILNKRVILNIVCEKCLKK